MAYISQQFVATTGATLTASIWNTEFQNLINSFNGGIDNANIANSAGIAYSKLALNNAIVNGDLVGSIAASKITDTAVTLTAVQTVQNKVIEGATVHGSIQPIETVTYAGSLVFDFDLATFKSPHKYCALAGNPIITFNNMADGTVAIVHLAQTSGGNSVTWPTVRWAGSVTPTLTATALKVDTFGFIKKGTDVFGYVIGKNI